MRKLHTVFKFLTQAALFVTGQTPQWLCFCTSCFILCYDL